MRPARDGLATTPADPMKTANMPATGQLVGYLGHTTPEVIAVATQAVIRGCANAYGVRTCSAPGVGYRDFAPGRRERISSRYCSIVKYRQSCLAAEMTDAPRGERSKHVIPPSSSRW